jgi:hypothetical protein
MKIPANKSKEIWQSLVRRYYFTSKIYDEMIGRKLMRIRFGKDGEFKPGRAAAYAQTRHRAIVKLFQEKIREERIRLNGGQLELPLN